MDRKRLGIAVTAIGLVLVVISALADPIGIGEGGGFGWKQVVGVIGGAVVVALGVWLLRSGSSSGTASVSSES